MNLLQPTYLRTARSAFAARALALLAPLAPAMGSDFYWDASATLDGNQNGTGLWTTDGNASFWTTFPSLFDSVFLP